VAGGAFGLAHAAAPTTTISVTDRDICEGRGQRTRSDHAREAADAEVRLAKAVQFRGDRVYLPSAVSGATAEMSFTAAPVEYHARPMKQDIAR
jgi:hypothetical protein